MSQKKNILVIIGSASKRSSGEKVAEYLIRKMRHDFDFAWSPELRSLPHFDPALSVNNPPPEIVSFRKAIDKADGLLICTPEYVFSIPSGLKNAIEWCIATTVFSDKPAGLICASADGRKGLEEMRLVMSTAMARFTDETCLLIGGIQSKFNKEEELNDQKTILELDKFMDAFGKLVDDSGPRAPKNSANE